MHIKFSYMVVELVCLSLLNQDLLVFRWLILLFIYLLF